MDSKGEGLNRILIIALRSFVLSTWNNINSFDHNFSKISSEIKASKKLLNI